MTSNDDEVRENFRKEYFAKIFRDGIPEEVAIEIGVATFAFSSLEARVDLAIQTLLVDLGATPNYAIGEMVTSEMTFSQKVNLFGSTYVFRAADTAERKQLRGVMKVLLKAAKKRNDLQHARFYSANVMSGKAEMARIKLKPTSEWGLAVTGQELNRTTVAKIVDQISHAAGLFSEFWEGERLRLGYTKETKESDAPKK